MSELEPDDSRDVTLSNHRAPGEPPRTGPREGETRAQAQQAERPRQPGSDGFATEGDSPEHPDRFADSIPQEQAQETQATEAERGDRWKAAAERAEHGPEGQ
jgi:hypothetical protein